MNRRKFIVTSSAGTGAALAAGAISCGQEVSEKEAGAINEKGNFKIRDLAPTPPLGWNSFDSYGVYLHHEAAMQNLEAMAEKLKPHGYEYFVIDGGWYGEFELVEGTLYPLEKHAKAVNMNEFGVYQPSKVYFNQGFEPIVSRAHELGLKIGIHVMRGVPRKAAEQKLPIRGTDHNCAEIADQTRICTWNDQNYGIDVSKPGAQEYYNSVFRQIADWKFDFVKVDDLTPYPDEILMIAQAIENSGRPMVYSLSPGNGISLTHLPYYNRANMMRITRDIWDRRKDLDKAFTAWKMFQGRAYRGFWPDMDMIPFGNLQLMSPEIYDNGEKNPNLSGEGFTRKCQLTLPQMRTFITMRALSASPLMMGGDLVTLDDVSHALITHPEMLACNQNGVNGTNTYDQDGIEVWIAGKIDIKGEGWIGVFNRNEKDKEVLLSRADLGLIEFVTGYSQQAIQTPIEITDIWRGESFVLAENTHPFSLQADDVAFLRFKS